MTDYRGTAIAGVWIGAAGIVAGLSYFGNYADAAIPLIIVAFILTINIMRQNPSRDLEEGLVKDLEGVAGRVSELEEKVDRIIRILEE
jgi:hypothetical protein